MFILLDRTGAGEPLFSIEHTCRHYINLCDPNHDIVICPRYSFSYDGMQYNANAVHRYWGQVDSTVDACKIILKSDSCRELAQVTD